MPYWNYWYFLGTFHEFLGEQLWETWEFEKIQQRYNEVDYLLLLLLLLLLLIIIGGGFIESDEYEWIECELLMWRFYMYVCFWGGCDVFVMY